MVQLTKGYKMLYKYNNKTQARKAYNDGETILVYTNKVRPNNPWISAYEINKQDGMNGIIVTSTDFDIRINNFEYHSCNSETGYYSSFYADVKKGA